MVSQWMAINRGRNKEEKEEKRKMAKRRGGVGKCGHGSSSSRDRQSRGSSRDGGHTGSGA